MTSDLERINAATAELLAAIYRAQEVLESLTPRQWSQEEVDNHGKFVEHMTSVLGSHIDNPADAKAATEDS